MLRTLKKHLPGLPPPEDLGGVRRKLAWAMMGKTVDLLADTRTIAHGIVAGVLIEAGMPKLVVNGLRYDLNQVLTVTA
jgi:hypothetical protein